MSTCQDPETYSIPTLILSYSWCSLHHHTRGHSWSPTTISRINLPTHLHCYFTRWPEAIPLTSIIPKLWLKPSSVGRFLDLVCPPLCHRPWTTIRITPLDFSHLLLLTLCLIHPISSLNSKFTSSLFAQFHRELPNDPHTSLMG